MASSSPQAFHILSQYPHRAPLDGDQIRALCNALSALNRMLGDENAIRTPIYCAILRLLKAHATPFPLNAPVTFAQVQAARLQLLAEKLLSERKHFPPQLNDAVREGFVSGFDPTTCVQISPDQQKQQLASQQVSDRHQILAERKQIHERQADFSRTRQACVKVIHARERQQTGPDPDVFVAWEQRSFKVSPPSGTNGQKLSFSPLDPEILIQERQRFLCHRTQSTVENISSMLKAHHDGTAVLSPRTAALLETRARHAKLLSLQAKMRQNVWEEHQLNDRDGRRGNRGRARTLKQLQREFEKVDRARTRQIEAEERDARRKRQAWMNALVEHLNKFRGYHRDVVRRGRRAVTKSVLKYHEDVARNTSRAEREAERARIQKLKEDDEEGYLELVRQTKNTRLLELLEQTDKYLRELGAVVKEERAKSGVVEYENGREKQGSRVDEIAHAIKEEVHEQSSLLVGGKLKEYQLQGIQWMVSLYNNRLHGILADEMGLGKTIQTLGLIAHLMEKKDNPGPYLIIVPLSTISNWEMEFARWSPAIRVIVFKGDKKTRRKLFENVIEKKSFNVCLVTYEYVVRGKNLLKRIEWQHLIIDEGHRIKNHEGRLSAVLHTHYKSRNRLLLTGTPLQNSLTELWALLNFLCPRYFTSAESFEEWFAAPFAKMGVGNVANSEEHAQLTEEENLVLIKRLHQLLRPFLLRRMKSDVLRMGEQLPEKQEHNILCEMSAWQKSMYLKILKSERLLFTDRHGRQRYDKLPNPAVQLRKCVNHPYLFFADHASKIVDSPQLWRSSGKFDMLDAIIMKLLRTGHRILIFNQMTKVVDLQERLLRYRNIPFYRLDGTTGTEERKQMVNDFNDEGTDVHVFLLTTRAGGLGVNLQTADTVIIFDSDWNPSMDQQAQDRAHRIGQRREVLVLRLLTAKSIEENVLERASFKRGLEKKIIRAGMFDEQSKNSERDAMLREFLRVEGGSDDDHPDDSVPTDEEVNRILARSEGEFEKFMEIDRERSTEISPRQKLLSDKEIPLWATRVPKALIQKAKTSGAGNWAQDIDGVDLEILNEPKKRRAATTNVSYGVDQLSERQYLKLMERSDAGEELSHETLRAATRKRKRRRKGEVIKSETADDDVERDESSLVVSDGIPSEDTLKESSSSVAMLASKSLNISNTDTKSVDYDATRAGHYSSVQSIADDLVIDDDDDDIPNGDNGSGSEKGLQNSPRPNWEESDSDSSGSQDVSPIPTRGRKRVADRASRENDRKRSRRDSDTNGVNTGRTSNSNAINPLANSPALGNDSQADSSEESAAPIRRCIPRKRSHPSDNGTRGSVVRNADLSDDEDGSIEPLTKRGRPLSTQRLSTTPRENLKSRFDRSSPCRVVSKSLHGASQASKTPLTSLVNGATQRTKLVPLRSEQRPQIEQNGSSSKGMDDNRQTAELSNQESERVMAQGSSISSKKTSRNTTAKKVPLSVPRNGSVPLPKLSSSPLTKKSSLVSTPLKSLKIPESKPKDALNSRKALEPLKAIDEATLPVLRKMPLSAPKKKEASSLTTLAPTTPEQILENHVVGSGAMTSSKTPPSMLPNLPKLTLTSRPALLSKQLPLSGAPSKPTLHSKFASSTRPVLSSIALISSPSGIPSRLLTPNAGKDLNNASKLNHGEMPTLPSQDPTVSDKVSNARKLAKETAGQSEVAGGDDKAVVDSILTSGEGVQDDEAEDGEIREEGELSEGSNGAQRASKSNQEEIDLPVLSQTPRSRVSRVSQHLNQSNNKAKLTTSSKHGKEATHSRITAAAPMRSPTGSSPNKLVVPISHQMASPSPNISANAPVLSRPTASTPVRNTIGQPMRPVPPQVSSRPIPVQIPRSGISGGRPQINTATTRPGPMPVRPSINPETLKTMRMGPTSAPIIAMPHLPPPGMPPMGIGGRGGMMGRGIGPPMMMPMGRGHYGGYGMRNGNSYSGPAMYGPNARIGGTGRHVMTSNYRMPYNNQRSPTVPLSTPPIHPPRPSPGPGPGPVGQLGTASIPIAPVSTNMGVVPRGTAANSLPETNNANKLTKLETRNASVKNGRTLNTQISTVTEDKTEADARSTPVVKPKPILNSGLQSEQHQGHGISKPVHLKDVEDGEEGEIEEEGEIKEK